MESFADFGGVLCLYILESLLPLDFSGLPEPVPTHRDQDMLLRAGRAGQVWGLSRGSGPSGTPAKTFRPC